MSTFKTEPAKGFEALDIPELESRRTRLANRWADAVKAEEADTGSEDGMSAATVEEVERIRAEYDLVVSTLKAANNRDDSERYASKVEDLTAGTRYARDRQAKVDAAAYAGIVAAGRNKYSASGKVADYCQTPNEVDLGQPCIAFNPARGVNEVMPFPFVSAGVKEGEDGWAKSLEASFRNAEILTADKVGFYDPVSGNKIGGHNTPVGRERLEADLTTTGSTYSLTTIGGMLYTYMVQENEFMSVCKIIQSPNINTYHVIRRSDVPVAGAVAENGAIPTSDSTFIANLQLTPKKYGFIKQYSYETTMQAEPWAMSQLVAMDSGIGLRNGIGQDLVEGPGTGNRMTGIKTFINGSGGATMRHAGVANGNFLHGSSQAFGVPEMAAFATSIPKEYLKSPNKRLVLPLVQWGRLMGLVDGEDRKLFRDSNASVGDLGLSEYNVRVLLDENLDGEDGTVAANDIPMLFGDFDGICVLLAGGPRMDFSTEYGYSSDALSLRTLQHVDTGVVDTNTVRGYRLS